MALSVLNLHYSYEQSNVVFFLFVCNAVTCLKKETDKSRKRAEMNLCAGSVIWNLVFIWWKLNLLLYYVWCVKGQPCCPHVGLNWELSLWLYLYSSGGHSPATCSLEERQPCLIGCVVQNGAVLWPSQVSCSARYKLIDCWTINLARPYFYSKRSPWQMYIYTLTETNCDVYFLELLEWLNTGSRVNIRAWKLRIKCVKWID